MTEHFDAPWGRTVKIVSVLSTGILLSVSALGVFTFPRQNNFNHWLMVGGPLLILAGTALFAVCGYALEDGCLVIQRPCWQTRFPLADVVSVAADPDAMKGSIRLAGDGGLFAFVGWFRNRKLSTYRAYVTDVNRCVVIRWPKRTIVISPGSPHRFIDALRY